jgi:hypothetical protein
MPNHSCWLDRQFSRTDSGLSLYLAAGGMPRWIAANCTVALGYFLLGFIVSRFFAAYGLFPAPIWLPTSIAVVAIHSNVPSFSVTPTEPSAPVVN